MLEVGDTAPDINLETDSGVPVRLGGEGEARVVFFYPKAMTPGCTVEASDFSALSDAFKSAGASVIGVSPDSPDRLGRFREKEGLAAPLLLASDADKEACEAFGVWQEKKMYGRTFMGVVRSTFIVDASGRIAEVWPKVRVKGHAVAVLDRLQKSTD